MSKHLKLMPECMAPDGAEPCAAYTETLDRIAELEARITEVESLHGGPEQMEKDIIQLMGMLAKSKIQTESAVKRIAELEADLAASEQIIGDLRTILDQKDRCIADLEAEVERLQQELQGFHYLEADLRAFLKDRDELAGMIIRQQCALVAGERADE